MHDIDMILLLVAFFLIKHCVCDWLLQSNHPYQFKNKGRYGHPGGILHAGIAALGSLVAILVWVGFIIPSRSAALCVVLMLMSSKVWIVLLAELFFHYHVDWLKVKLNHWLKLDMNKDADYWHLVGIDQMIHGLSYIAMIWFLFRYNLG